MRKQVIAYLHTHWDREWYREFEIFRMRLLRVFDNVLDMLEKGRIPSFYFDGQVCALEDYLEIRPEIASRKLFIGPFYCLVDEFLTDRTVFSKNLELGMKKAIEWGCLDFIGYLADTFGHSQNVPEILREFGIDKCIVWRGCKDEVPADFKWFGMNTVNLVRGYFNDVFSLKSSIEEKAEIIKKNLDLIAEKSSNCILMPIGADHLGVEEDIVEQISAVNEILKDYHIKLGSPFDYFKKVENNFDNYILDDELRDNSKTFTLQGCYSSRLDLKRYNVECSHKLDLASRFVRFIAIENQELAEKYTSLLNYAYKMLIKNQAHDSICGCSTDDVHNENIIRYKKILQIAQTIIDELKFTLKFDEKAILNLSNKPFSGVVEIDSVNEIKGLTKISETKGFDKMLLTDTQRIPVTEDYVSIGKYLAEVKNLHPDEIEFIASEIDDTDFEITDNLIKNAVIKFEIEDNKMFVNDVPFSIVDFKDNGDSYNNAPSPNDKGCEFKIMRSRKVLDTKYRVALKIDFESVWDLLSLTVSLDKGASFLCFKFDWENSQKNHILCAKFEMPTKIDAVYSEDMNLLIKRTFDSSYNIRENLPREKGLEVKNNTAPMQRGLLIDEKLNNIGVVTKGLTQYEVFENNLYIPILRATGMISNPFNSARTTPAGPPIDTPALQMRGKNMAELFVFFGNQNAFGEVIDTVYKYIIV